MSISAGDRVIWDYKPPGGYGYAIPVAGIVAEVIGARALVRVAKKFAGTWTTELKSVAVSRLRERTSICPELGES